MTLSKANLDYAIPPTFEVVPDILLRTFECVVGGKYATYVSGPITTGPAFLKWYIDLGRKLEHDPRSYQQSHVEHVIRPNEAAIIDVARKLRAEDVGLVIEPASLKVACWGQSDFHAFWGSVLDRYVSRVIMLDGWQYSVGCAIEFKHAIRNDIVVQERHGHLIQLNEGIDLIMKAVEALELQREYGELQSIARMLREQASTA